MFVLKFKLYLGPNIYHVCATGEFAYHGHRVKLYDHNEAPLNSAYSRIEEDKAYLIEEGLLASQNFVVV